MSTSKIGRGFADLPIDEQVLLLRDHVIRQDLLIHVLLTVVQKLGVHFTWGDEAGPENVEQGMSNPDAGA